mgnify:CR=1 FL=1
MKTMQEVQALIRNLREIYTDVRLLDEATVERIQEGKRTDPCGEDLCYAATRNTSPGTVRPSRPCAPAPSNVGWNFLTRTLPR